MPRFYVSNVIFAMNGAFKYYKKHQTYVLRCTTIGFKQRYGHKSSRRAHLDYEANIRFHGGNRSVFRSSQIMILCYMTSFLFMSLYKIPYFTEILDRNIELEMWLHFYCWWVWSDCAIRETWVLRGKGSLRQANVGNYMKEYSLPLIFKLNLDIDTSVLELFPVGVLH